MAGVVEAGADDVGKRHGGMDDGAGPVERPEPEPEIGVVGDGDAGRAGDPHRGEDGVGGARRDRLADAGGMEDAGALDHRRRAYRSGVIRLAADPARM